MRDGWSETTLGDVAEVVGGGTPSTAKEEFWDGDVIWLTPTEVTAIDGKVVFDSKRKITQAGLRSSGARILPRGTVILTSRASVGFVALAGIELTTNQGFQSLIPSELVDGVFLMFWIQMNRSEFESRSAGSTFKEISKSNVKSIAMNLPPLAEQKRIVDVVSSVDSYIDALQQQADSARTARDAVLHELLSAGGDGWTETTLGETLEMARGGSPRPIQEFITRDESGVNWIKIADATASSKYIYRTNQKIRVEGVQRSRSVKIGDFLLSNSMSFGRPYIMKTDGCIHDGWLLLGKVDKFYDEDFLYNLLMSDLLQKQFNSLAAGSGVRNLKIEVAKEVQVHLPPLETQRHIAQIANSMDEVIRSTEQAVVEAKNLRSGLLSDLLSGNHEIPASYDSLLGAA